MAVPGGVRLEVAGNTITHYKKKLCIFDTYTNNKIPKSHQVDFYHNNFHLYTLLRRK